MEILPGPEMTVEVDDVDAVHRRALARDGDIVYPLRDEEWSVRRFFLKDPNGTVVDVMMHPH